MNEMNPDKPPHGRILLTGAGGMTGRSLLPLLKQAGYEVAVLYRNSPPGNVDFSYRWNPGEGYLEPGALSGVTHIIHLAGAGIGDRRWSRKRKQEIARSRVDTARMLFDHAIREGNNLKCFVTASGTGYYGANTGNRIFTEDDSPGDDFLALVCVMWEEAADLFRNAGIRTVKLRTGVVLSRKGGFVSKVSKPMNAGVAAWFGDGRQYVPWIHIDDLCRIYLRALTDETMDGAFNAVAPASVTQRELILLLRRKKKIPVLAAGIPAFITRLLFGEMSSMLLYGSRVSPTALESAGFGFLYPDPAVAVDSL